MRKKWLCGLGIIFGLAFIVCMIFIWHNSWVSNLNSIFPRPDHIVIVVEENKSYHEIINLSSAPYIQKLAKEGASFTNFRATERPSQPNYFNLFSGSHQGVQSNDCPNIFSTSNLGGNLLKAGYTFTGYSEDLPYTGFTGCNYDQYARKHNPWVNFTDIPPELNQPFSSFPKDNFEQLPTLSFVVPNLDNDMHDKSIDRGDNWLKENMGPYIEWAKTHNSLFILTWDEGNLLDPQNHIPTIMVGPMIRKGEYDQKLNHFDLLRTLEDLYFLPYAGKSTTARGIHGIWQ